jgi:allantoinase
VIRGTLVTPEGSIENAWVATSDGRIAAIGQGAAPEAERMFDAGDALIFPGVVDGQTHAGSYAGYAGIASTTRSAAAGGVTTIVDMPYDNPAPLASTDQLDAKVAAIHKQAHVNVALYATVMPGQAVGAVRELVDAGVVAFKISAFESSPTRFPRIGADLALDLLEALAPTNIPLGLHNEDQEIVRARIARARAAGAEGIRAHSSSRPPAAELASTAHFLELGAAAGAHAHIVHLTLERGFHLVDNYRRQGYRATGELCCHYLWFDPEVDGQDLGARMKVNPPIRPGEIERLWNAVLGKRVAFVSSDHSSWPIDNKLAASIFDAGAGVPGVETLLPAFFTAASGRVADAAAVTASMLCERPARFFGLWPRKGAIRVGSDADLAILAPVSSIWHAANANDDLNWSPYEGRSFGGTVIRTYVGGELAWDGKAIVNSPGDGKYVRRGSGRWFE